MQIDEKTFLVNSPIALAAFCSFVAKLFAEKKYLTFTWRIGKVFYINRRKGLVRAFVEPLQFDKHKKRLLVKTFYGQVEVVTRG